MHILEAEDRIYNLYRAHTQALKAAKNTEAIETRPHTTNSYFLKKLKPFQIYRRMMDIKNVKKNKGSHEGNLFCFLRKVGSQAKNVRNELQLVPSVEQQLEILIRKISKIRKLHTKRMSHVPETHQEENQNINVLSNKKKRWTHLTHRSVLSQCVEKKKRSPYIRKCDILDKATKDKLLKDFRKTGS